MGYTIYYKYTFTKKNTHAQNTLIISLVLKE